MELSQRELSNAIRVPFKRVNKLVNGRRGTTPSTELRLARFFDMTPGHAAGRRLVGSCLRPLAAFARAVAAPADVLRAWLPEMKHALRSALRALALFACLLALHGNSRAASSLLVYDFELRFGPVGNVDHVRSLGFEGIVTGVATPADLAKLQAYADHVETLDGFDLLAFVVYDFADPESPRVWRSALPTLASAGAPLWVIVRNAPSTAAVQNLLREMAVTSQLLAIPTVIYPHWDTSIESAAEAATLIAQVAHPNLSNSLHTCHEIRAGNQYDLPAVVAAHASQTALVTIAGAQDNAYAGPPPRNGLPWDDAIMPLDRGDFDLHPFLQALKDANYDGRVILHTFGITDDPGHLQRSLRQYEEYLAGLR